MKRRQFIKNTVIVSSGLLLVNPLVSCSGSSLKLEELIGQPQELLNTYDEFKQGNNKFGYYLLKSSLFNHNLFKGESVLVYYDDNKIIGYTIKIKGTKNFVEYQNQLTEIHGKGILDYKNDFGESYKWISTNHKYNLEKVNGVNLPSNTFFSESLSQ